MSAVLGFVVWILMLAYLWRFTLNHAPKEEHPKFLALLVAMLGLYICMAAFVYGLPETADASAWAKFAMWGAKIAVKMLLALMTLYVVQLARAGRLPEKGMATVGIGGLLLASLLFACSCAYAADVFAALSIGVLAGAVNVWIWGRR